MEIVFCADKKLNGCELLMISYELNCPPPTLEGYFCRKENGEDGDLIEYQIKECPPMANLPMDKKMDNIVLAFMMASTNAIKKAWLPQWIHLYYGYGKSRQFLAYLSWRPNRYFNKEQYETAD